MSQTLEDLTVMGDSIRISKVKNQLDIFHF